MGKQQGRKPPRRKPPSDLKVNEGHDDLRLLAEVLAERQIAVRRLGWFAIPWNYGPNAVRFACNLWCFARGLAGPDDAMLPLDLLQAIHKWIDCPTSAPEIYERCSEETSRLATIVVHGAEHTVARLGIATLRCMQLWMSNSDGGGHGYNVVLRTQCMPFIDSVNELASMHQIDDLMRAARLRDVLGVDGRYDGTSNDRLRRAFTIAWERSLFHAAYALPRAKDI